MHSFCKLLIREQPTINRRHFSIDSRITSPLTCHSFHRVSYYTLRQPPPVFQCADSNESIIGGASPPACLSVCHVTNTRAYNRLKADIN